MKHLYSAYPAGMPGAAFFLLRLSLALLVSTLGGPLGPCLCDPLLLLSLAIAIAVGFWARACAIVALVLFLLNGTGNQALALFATHILDALALAFVGAGAYSFDGLIFGRSTIVLRS